MNSDTTKFFEALANAETPPWIHGLKSLKKSIDRPNSWNRVVCNIILHRGHDIDQRLKTTDAEKGLGIGSSWYYFIARNSKPYDNGIFFAIINRTISTETDGGVSPFDSGGVWYDKLVTNPSLKTSAEKKNFFEANSHPLLEWPKLFSAYIQNNYSGIAEYIRGQAPRIGISNIVYNLSNNAFAWTWEGRIAREKNFELAKYFAFICSDIKYRSLINWLRKQPIYSLREKKTILKWLQKTCAVIPYMEGTDETAQSLLLRWSSTAA